jgi:hypothetical protein
MSELLNDVIADYELKDRHGLDSMARHLIDKYLLPHFGRYRAANVKVPVITSVHAQPEGSGPRRGQHQPGVGVTAQGLHSGRSQRQGRTVHGPDFKGLFQQEKNARQGFWEHSEYEKFRDVLPVDERGLFIMA